MKKALLAAVVMLMLAGIVDADPFMNPPEQYWPYDGPPLFNPWVTPFPYQRNIRYNFNDPANIFLPHYEGYDDPTLFPSDYVEWQGLLYYPTEPVTGSRVGVIGIDNRQGTAPVEGYLLFHIDNWDFKNEWKHIWKEVMYVLGPGAEIDENVTLPPGFEVIAAGPVFDNAIGDTYRLETYAWKIWENPPWEEITITLTVPAGSYAFIDDVHFATECVPEPATMLLAGTALIGLAALRRRRTRT